MRRRGDPVAVVPGHAAAGDDAVQVIMIAQRLAPGVQHRGDSQLSFEPLRSELQERLRSGVKQQFEKRGAVLTDQRVERVRQREDQMEIGHGQERGRLLREPIHCLRALAVRTMTVAATVGHDVFASAGGTIKRLCAQRTGAALRQGVERFPLVGAKRQRPCRRGGEERTQDLAQRGAGRHAVGSCERSSSCNGPAICARRS